MTTTLRSGVPQNRHVTLPALLGTAATTLVAGLALTASASAAPVGDPAVWQVTPEQTAIVAGVPTRIALAGDATKTAATAPNGDVDPAAALTVLPPGVACPGSYAETVGEVYSRSYDWTAGSPAAAPFSLPQAITFDQPGIYTACGYYGLTGTLALADDQDATTLVYTPRTFTVQRPTVGVDVRLDGPRYPGATIKLLGSASANAPETVSVHLNQADQACQSTAPANTSLQRFALPPDPIPVYGTRQIATTVTLPDRVGDYRLCVYAARDGQDGDPDLAVDTAGRPDGTIQVREAPAAASTPPVIYGTGKSGTKQPICRLTPFSPRQGERVTIVCRGISGKIAIGLKKSRSGPVRHSHVVTLSAGGRASIPTKNLKPGAWYSQIKWDDKLAQSTNFYVKTAVTKARSKTRSAASRRALSRKAAARVTATRAASSAARATAAHATAPVRRPFAVDR
ncbi:hypothetical protein AB0L40_10975 [Patulibacter sp. NPDC049589]|uniref:hypothetical protein n=1 Tax=Patulibacter sp. NPDC049589 TaxID=3154731 RepID=UPI00342263A1